MGKGCGDGGDVPGASAIVYGVELSYEALRERLAIDNEDAKYNYETYEMEGLSTDHPRIDFDNIGASPPSLYEQTAQKAMRSPDARSLWDQAASGRGPFSRLALDAPFQEKAPALRITNVSSGTTQLHSGGLAREFSDPDRTVDSWFRDDLGDYYDCWEGPPPVHSWLDGLHDSAAVLFPHARSLRTSCDFLVTEPNGYHDGPAHSVIAYLPGTCVEYAGKMWPERVEVQKIPREDDLDPSRVYAFRKIVQELLIPAGVVDMEALASRGGGPRFLHAMWTLYEHC